MKSSHVFLSVAAAIVVLWLATPIVIPHLTKEDVGKFGDMFGATNALFSGLALVGAVYAILLQREELIEQRMEFERQTEQFRLQNELITKQIKAAESQSKAALARETLASLPLFRFGSSTLHATGENFLFENVGANIYRIKCSIEGNAGYLVEHDRLEAWRRDEQSGILVSTPDRTKPHPYTLRIEYTTFLGERRCSRYRSKANSERPTELVEGLSPVG